MYKLKKNERDDNMLLTPSFSSTLLDQIYRSIDDGERKSGEKNFYRHTTMSNSNKKQSKTNFKTTTTETERKKPVTTKQDRKSNRDEDVLFFSSTSISSDSSFGFSSSDTESMSRVSCFAPRPKVVRGSTSFRAEKHGMRVFDGLCRNSQEHVRVPEEQVLIKSKSRALKIYNNLKKVKQPISPGGRVTSFLNSLFSNARKTSNSNSSRACDEERVPSSSCYDSSTCSSVSSFSRSCLNKTLSSERDTLRNGVKRTVRFYPVSVIVGEHNRPCDHKRLCEEKEASREFLREYQKKSNDLVLKELSSRTNVSVDNDNDEDDDASSYASSDLFELDHLAAFGSERYCEELPVYETTHVRTNRAIANGLIV